jgi:hypothetical protein
VAQDSESITRAEEAPLVQNFINSEEAFHSGLGNKAFSLVELGNNLVQRGFSRFPLLPQRMALTERVIQQTALWRLLSVQSVRSVCRLDFGCSLADERLLALSWLVTR